MFSLLKSLSRAWTQDDFQSSLNIGNLIEDLLLFSTLLALNFCSYVGNTYSILQAQCTSLSPIKTCYNA